MIPWFREKISANKWLQTSRTKRDDIPGHAAVANADASASPKQQTTTTRATSLEDDPELQSTSSSKASETEEAGDGHHHHHDRPPRRQRRRPISLPSPAAANNHSHLRQIPKFDIRVSNKNKYSTDSATATGGTASADVPGASVAPSLVTVASCTITTTSGQQSASPRSSHNLLSRKMFLGARNRVQAGVSSSQTAKNAVSELSIAVPLRTSSALASENASAVAESKQSPPSTITVRVISIKGGFVEVSLPPHRTGRDLKLEAIGRFVVDTNALPLYASNLECILNKYKLITINGRHVIDEAQTLDRLQLRHKDELLLVVKRGGNASGAVERKREEMDNASQLRAPSQKEIMRATENVRPTPNAPPKVNIDDMVLQTDLQYDIRKILISLAESSAYVIGAGPYANRLILMLKQRLINRRKNETDSLDCLLDMGFDRHRAQYALHLKRHVYADALRFLIENPRVQIPTPAELETAELFNEVPLMRRRSSDLGSAADEGSEEDNAERWPHAQVVYRSEGEQDGDDEREDEDRLETEEEVEEYKALDATTNISFNTREMQIGTLLEIIRIHAQRDMPVCEEMVAKLMEMGFEESEVREALKITQNNQATACEWLIGGRSKSLTELRDGLPADSPVLKALLQSPQVQISLGNPKMLLAYLSMLDNYSSLNMWLNDTDTSGVLGHILRTYHEEKHISAINQFSVVL